MPRFSANLSLLFGEYPLLERPARARDAGFTAVEIQFPYDAPASALGAAVASAAMDVVLFNVPAGDLTTGGLGLAGVPGREEEFARTVDRALDYARVLRPGFVNVLAGRRAPHTSLDTCHNTLVTNLRRAAAAFAPLGVGVVFEAINTVDLPGFLVSNVDRMESVLAQANHPNLGMQFDIYHMHQMEVDGLAALQRVLPQVHHVQFADFPGRHEPGTGEIDFAAYFTALDAGGYTGRVGAEYRPLAATVDSLGWFKERE